MEWIDLAQDNASAVVRLRVIFISLRVMLDFSLLPPCK
jgi:hypothetical protein